MGSAMSVAPVPRRDGRAGPFIANYVAPHNRPGVLFPKGIWPQGQFDGRTTEPMRPQDHKRDDEGRRDDWALSAWLPAFTLLPLIFLAFLGAAHMLHRDALRPAIGDIVVFRPELANRDIFPVMVAALRVGKRADQAPDCLLNSSVMGIGGGSLVVEQRLGVDPPRFRVHWAGSRTAAGGRDCGASATIEIERVGLRKLASAAGGIGLGRAGWLR